MFISVIINDEKVCLLSFLENYILATFKPTIFNNKRIGLIIPNYEKLLNYTFLDFIHPQIYNILRRIR
jgi:hypothetical protein